MKLLLPLSNFASNKKYVAGVVIALATLGILIIGLSILKGNANSNSEFAATHARTFFEQNDFNRGLKTNNLFKMEMPIYGGIVPHHLIPSEALTTFFTQLQKQKPKRIILIAPNHFIRGDTPFVTSPHGYNTPFGTVSVDPDLYRSIANADEKNFTISRNDDALNEEHGIGGLMTYLSYYLPETKITPVILWPTTNYSQIEAFSKVLAPLIDEDTIFIASIDFSHYLPAQVAEEKDKTTWDLIVKKKYEDILRLNNNDYLDTPPSLVTMLKTMDQIGAKNMHQLYHSNSGFIMNDYTMPTTSYFFISFTK